MLRKTLATALIALGVLLAGVGHLAVYYAARREQDRCYDFTGAFESWVEGYPPKVYCAQDGIEYVHFDTTVGLILMLVIAAALVAGGAVLVWLRPDPYRMTPEAAPPGTYSAGHTGCQGAHNE